MDKDICNRGKNIQRESKLQRHEIGTGMVLLNLSETAIRKRWTEHDKNKTVRKIKDFS